MTTTAPPATLPRTESPVALDSEATSVPISVILGLQLWLDGDDERAATTWALLTQSQPSHRVGWFWLGLALLRQGRGVAAAQAFHLAGAGDWVPRMMLDIHRTAGLDAIEPWLPVASRTRSAGVAVCDRARALARNGESDSAVQLLEAFLRHLAPDSVDWLRCQATLVRIHGETRDASELYRLALELRPDDMDLLAGRRSALLDLGQYADALVVAQREAELAPTDPARQVTVASVFRLMGEYHQAQEWIQRALRQAPEWWPAYRELGAIVCAEGASVDGLRALNRAARLAGSEAPVAMAVAQCIYSSSGREAAMDYVADALIRLPSGPETRPLYGLLGDWYLEDGRPDSAKSMYLQGLEAWPDSVSLRVRLERLLASSDPLVHPTGAEP